MTPVEACKALNENSVNAVRRLAEHMGVDPVGLSERLASGGLIGVAEVVGELLHRKSECEEVLSPFIEAKLRGALTSLRGDQ